MKQQFKQLFGETTGARRGEVLGARACDVEEEVQAALWSNICYCLLRSTRGSLCASGE